MIAIIGGFMVRKLIAVSTERHEITTRLADYDEQIKFQTERLEKLDRFTESASGTDSLEKLERDRERLDSEIKLLEIERRHAVVRLDALKEPRGMKRGLLVFVIFTALGIFLPLTLAPFQTDSYPYYLGVKAAVLAMFVLCLALVYRYLLYLLNWKQEDVVRRWREYLPNFSKKN